MERVRQRRRLALEFTPNYNDSPGGFLVDPNSPENGGTFALGLGQGASRNTVLFTRPSAGQWHHYALRVRHHGARGDSRSRHTSTASPSPSARAHTASEPDNFANSRLYFMSRGGTALSPSGTTLFGAGTMDELAVYDRVLSAAEVSSQYNSTLNNPPNASFTASPNPASTGQSVSFNGSGSTDPDGTIAKYEWDLDGNGSYETDTGTTPTTSTTYATSGNRTVGLRVTDDKGATSDYDEDRRRSTRRPRPHSRPPRTRSSAARP